MKKVAVYDKGGRVVGLATPNTKFDEWDGHNWCCGVGRHMGYTKLKRSGAYVVIHTSEHAGERDSAVLIEPDELIGIAARKGCLDELLEDFPELKELADKLLDTD